MKKILIVDDEVHITKALSRELRQWSQEKKIAILTSNISSDVPDIIKKDSDIFLLLTDMMMPGLTGAELSKKVREINREIIVIIMTGYAHIDLVVKAVSSGISSLIIKPWNVELLLIELDNSLEKYLLKEREHIYKKRIEEELKWGGELQKLLLKRELPDNSKVKFSVYYKPLPSLFCGGDYYDIIPVSESRYIIISADVAGHGIKAAFITTILKSIIFNGYIKEHIKDFRPAGFLTWLNNRLNEELQLCPDILITSSVILLDLDTSSIVYSNAGHLPFYLMENNRVHEIHIEGPAMNFAEDILYKEKMFRIGKGNKIYIFTDGLLEIGKNNQMLDSYLIKSQLLEAAEHGENAEFIYNRFLSLSEKKAFEDDVTIIILEL